MEQHPIPQQITSYEFKLVGDMTIRQFGKAAGGIVLALLINATHLVFFIKWPLALVSASTGLAMAFVPFQDRPLETWIFSFIRSIYSPTLFIWKKRADKNWLEIDRSKRLETSKEDEEDFPQKDQKRIDEFIASLPSVKQAEDREDEPVGSAVKIVIPNQKTDSIKVTQKSNDQVVTEVAVGAEDWRTQRANLNLKTTKDVATGTAVFGSIPMPATADIPNVLVGMVTDAQGKIVDDAIIEIQDTSGNSVRVLKTNLLGQFKTATQLANGTYLIIPEKQDLKFDKVNVELTGQIMQPVRIQAMA